MLQLSDGLLKPGRELEHYPRHDSVPYTSHDKCSVINTEFSGKPCLLKVSYRGVVSLQLTVIGKILILQLLLNVYASLMNITQCKVFAYFPPYALPSRFPFRTLLNRFNSKCRK